MTAGSNKSAKSAGNVRDRLVQESARLFMEHGYERTTMRNIAQAAGIKLGSIAYYFRSKEDILYETMSAVIEAGEQKALATLNADDAPKSKLKSLIEVELDSFLNDTGAIVMKEWRSLGKAHRSLLVKHQQVYENIWLDVLTECHDRGIIRCKPKIARRVLHGAFAWSDSWNGGSAKSSIGELADEIMNLISHD